MGKQLGFHIDQHRCIGCKACQVACKDKNDLEVGELWRRVNEFSGGSFTIRGNGYIPQVYAYWVSLSCNHCNEPKCVENCPTGALTKRQEDGVVTVDSKKCVGCRYCTWSCPYDAPQYHKDLGQVRKCNFCIDLLSRGEDPACVAACPVRAIHYGPIDELQKKYGGTKDLKGLPDSSITEPNIIFTPHKDAMDK